VASLEAEFALSPEITLAGEYSWSSYEGDETESERKRGNAFRLGASAYWEKLTLDGSYEKTGQSFFFPLNPSLSGGGEEYDLSTDYFFSDYLSGTLYYNQYHENSSEQGGIFSYSLADVSLLLPKLPSLSITYDTSENLSNEGSEVLVNDITDTFTVGLSYPIKISERPTDVISKRVKLSLSHSRSDHKDKTEIPSRETTVSDTYEISFSWGKEHGLLGDGGILFCQCCPAGFSLK